MEFHVYETGETIKAKQRPIMIITSNNEKELPDAFLRRCFFHYIRFPDHDTMKKIVEVHHPGIKPALLTTALTQFYEIRDTAGLKRNPRPPKCSTGSNFCWLKTLMPRTSAVTGLTPCPTARRAVEERTGRAPL